MNVSFGGPSTSVPSIAGAQANKDRKMASAEHLVLDLSNPDLRENALLELSKVTFARFDSVTSYINHEGPSLRLSTFGCS